MLPTVLRRPGLILSLCDFVVFTTGRFVLSHAFSWFSCFLPPVWQYDHRVNFCPFSLPLDVGDWLMLVIVALLGRLY